MKKPHKATVLGKKFDVVFQDPGGLNPNSSGRIVCDIQTIWIDQTNHEERQKEVFLHEAIHALDFHANLELPEKAVGILASLLFDFVRRNRKAMKWVMEK